MRRRTFITLLGGAAAALPLAARAQQREQVRRVGLFMPGTADDSEYQAGNGAFLQALGELGWIVGRNVRIDYRWGAGDVDRYRATAANLVSLAPDVVLAEGTATVSALQKATRSVPIVFVDVVDPVGGSLVASLARPGGNATGFLNLEFGFSGKWLELLKEIAPKVSRVAVIRDPAIASQIGMFGGIQSVAPSLGVELRPIDVRDSGEMERAVVEFAGAPNSGLIVTPSAQSRRFRDLIFTLAARHRLPTVSSDRSGVVSGGLISYGPDRIDMYRRAAGYVDRILKGEKPADLPVQAPTKYQLVINLKTAKSLGLEIPTAVLARADDLAWASRS
jgi:putative tryptophan/tyrosine transport system substrate-binding protein